jgi:hypothetical protein
VCVILAQTGQMIYFLAKKESIIHAPNTVII